MLIIADLSGIQEYLFQVRETGGRQARSLRFRSLFIQLVSEAIGIRLLHAAGLDDQHIIFSAAGKIAIDCTGLTGDRMDPVREEVRLIEKWLRENTHGRLRLSVVIHDEPPPEAPITQRHNRANRALQSRKLRAWSNMAVQDRWRSSELVVQSTPDPDQEAERDAELGRRVVQPGSRFLVMENAGSGVVDIAGLSTRFVPDRPTNGNRLHVRDMADVMRHVPMTNGQAVEFVDLADQSRGAAMLGVLKADADSLGNAVRRCMEGAADLGPLRRFSRRLKEFFASDLDNQIRDRWSNLYTVFSGGDDLLLVGPWNIVLDFAGHLHEQFAAAFKQDGLTISAGVAIVKPKFPIHLAARQAEDLLDQAKSQSAPGADAPKDQCATLGGVWKWDAHTKIIADGKQLANWVDTGVIERGWLHTLLELVLLRRGLAGPEYAGVHPAVATSRLTYHVARNWREYSNPRDDHQHAANAARKWIDAVIESFDADPSQAPARVAQLPAIIRYAMLATRSHDSGDRS